MSNSVLPSFQGWSYEKSKTPVHSTGIITSKTGKELRIQNYPYPIYKFSPKFFFMTDSTVNSVSLDKSDVETFMGFFNAHGGAFDDFLYLDDVENTVTDQQFGVGNGSTKEFQLVRNIGSFVEPIKGITETPVIKINDVATADFAFDNHGKITFTNAPANGATLKWSGEYYFRVRFQEDELDLNRTFIGMYENISINLVTVL